MNLAKYIDHTILKPQASKTEVEALCQEAKKYGFFSVCVNPYWVPFCKKQLEGSDVKVCTSSGSLWVPIPRKLKYLKPRTL